jgi:hypothetical protein
MSLESIIRGVATADADGRAIPCLRLLRVASGPFRELREECLRLSQCGTPSDACAARHVTRWAGPYGTVRQYSLWNRSGRFDDFSADHDQSCLGKAFHHAADYPALAAFLSAFPHRINSRLNVLGAGSGLRPHREHVCLRARSGGVGLRLRFHLPVVTGPGAAVLLGGEVYAFEEGVVYLFNQGCVHGARNDGPAERLHLIWDLLLTSEAAQVMFGEDAPPLQAERFVGPDREVPSCGPAPTAGFQRIPPMVTPEEAWSAALIPPQ